MYLFCLMFVLPYALANTFFVHNQPQSPCPSVFRYEIRPDFYHYGLLTVPSPPLNRASVVLVASFVLHGRLPTRYGGLIELLRTQNETIDDIKQNRPVQFVVNFPVQSPLPRLNFVLFNQRIICGRPDQDAFNVKTRLSNRIDFRYTFNTSEIIPTGLDDVDISPITIPVRESFPASTNESEPNLSLIESKSLFECGFLHDNFVSTSLMPDGTTIERGSWPWLVAIYAIRTSGPHFVCAGTLVSPKIILTAASCFSTTTSQLLAHEILIVAGRHNMSDWLETNTQSVYISSLHIHPNFVNGSTNDDIALIILRANLLLNEFVIPACLHTDSGSAANPNRFVGTIVGWYDATNINRPISSTPVSVIISTVHSNICGCTRESIQGGQLERILCVGNRNKAATISTCYGNRGSGFVTLTNNRLTLRGIVTTGCEQFKKTEARSCANSGFITLTDVTKYTHWYNKILLANL